jgi:hypothetical protein
VPDGPIPTCLRNASVPSGCVWITLRCEIDQRQLSGSQARSDSSAAPVANRNHDRAYPGRSHHLACRELPRRALSFSRSACPAHLVGRRFPLRPSSPATTSILGERWFPIPRPRSRTASSSPPPRPSGSRGLRRCPRGHVEATENGSERFEVGETSLLAPPFCAGTRGASGRATAHIRGIGGRWRS